MTKGRLLFTVLTAGIFIGCTNPFAGRSDAPGSDSTVRLDSLLPQKLTEPAYTPTDSLRKQLGGPLFEAPDPDDSITLLEIKRNIYAGDTTLCYRYIEHNRAHPVYRWFENDSLKRPSRKSKRSTSRTFQTSHCRTEREPQTCITGRHRLRRLDCLPRLLDPCVQISRPSRLLHRFPEPTNRILADCRFILHPFRRVDMRTPHHAGAQSRHFGQFPHPYRRRADRLPPGGRAVRSIQKNRQQPITLLRHSRYPCAHIRHDPLRHHFPTNRRRVRKNYRRIDTLLTI